MKKILYTKPSITQLEIDYVTDAITNGWGAKCYDYILKFENLFKKHIGSKYALSSSSCTGALHIAFATIGLKPDDEVIAPDITWSASIVPITYLGAKPIFVDILKDSWCIDPNKIEQAITQKTKAILAVHLYGNLAEMDAIMKIAKKYNLYVIEDAAEALGSEYNGKKAGSIGDFGVFSFHGTKTMTTGEGGMLVTNNPALYEKARILWDHGRDPKIKKTFWVEYIGYKYKMSNLQAALGLAQLERIEELVNKKREVFNWYKKGFADIKGIKLNPEPEHTKNSYWMPTAIFDKSLNIDRDDLIKYMNENKVDVRNFFYPNSMFPMFENVEGNAVSYDIYNRGVNLPNYFEMTYDDCCYIINLLIKYIKVLLK